MSEIAIDEALKTANFHRNKEFNEFERIAGLEPATRRWLRESFNVYTLEDLACLSIERVLASPVLAQLEDKRKTICQRKLEHWVRQAQEFVDQKTNWQTFATFVITLQSRQIGGQTEQRTVAYFLETDRKAVWSGVECNGVYELMLEQIKHTFRLDTEASSLMTPEPNIEPERRDPIPALPEEGSSERGTPPDVEGAIATPPKPSESSPESGSLPEAAASNPDSLPLKPCPSPGAAPTSEGSQLPETAPDPIVKSAVKNDVAKFLHLKITQLKFLQFSSGERLGSIESGVKDPEARNLAPEKSRVVSSTAPALPITLLKEHPLELEVTFQIEGESAVELTRAPLQYRVQCFIQSLESGETIQLENSSPGSLIEQQVTYSSRLQSATLPPGDAYRFQVVASLKGEQVGPDLFELPFVQFV